MGSDPYTWGQTPPGRARPSVCAACAGWRSRLEIDRPRDAGDRAAADPDRPVGVRRDVHAPRAAEHRALAGHVGSARAPGAQQPLGQRGVEAPGDRILDVAPSLGKNARTSKSPAEPCGCGPTTPMSSSLNPGPHCEHGVRVASRIPDPGQAVVGPGRIHDLPRSMPRMPAIRAPVPPRPRRSAAAAARRTRGPARPAAPARARRRTPARSRRRASAARRARARRGRCRAWGDRRTAASSVGVKMRTR